MSRPLIETRDLQVHFPLRKGLLGRATAVVRAVDGVTLSIAAGEVLGLVGESGSGKSTLGRAVMALEQPTGGEIFFDSQPHAGLDTAGLRSLRSRMQMVFQDPFSSLNPRMTVEESLAMPLRFTARELGRAERRQRVEAALERVGLGAGYLHRYPHEFSGGQRQRIGIARALMVEPEFIMADEPVSALDVSVQAQVLNLFARIQREMNLTLLFVTHDLAVVGHVADRVAVMYLGRVVEIAPTRALFSAPRHPYSEALLSAAPDPVPGRATGRIMLEGEMPSPLNPPSGCPFRTRCRYALPACAEARPDLRPVERDGADERHLVACIRDDLELVAALQEDEAQP
ncbi:MAG: dipeptide ABC transporter ATP-binding protein [Rhodospirillales bacterium]